MEFKDWFYIGLIIVAGVCGAMLNTHGDKEALPLERDVKLRDKQLIKLKLSYDSLENVAIEARHQITVDSLKHCNDVAEYNNRIRNLNTKINAISFKGYSNDRLDSLINNLYGAGTIHRAN